ncbi:hypothetical protein ACWXWE_07080 [Pantoea ananatis]
MKNDLGNAPAMNEFLRELHHLIEAGERKRISQAVMAGRLGVSTRTYLEYLRGTNSPLGMRVVLELLCMLDDQSVIQVIQHWREAKQINKPKAAEARI